MAWFPTCIHCGRTVRWGVLVDGWVDNNGFYCPMRWNEPHDVEGPQTRLI